MCSSFRKKCLKTPCLTIWGGGDVLSLEACDNVQWALTKQEGADTRKFSWWLGISLQFLGWPYFAPIGVAVDCKGSKETNWGSACTKGCFCHHRLCRKPKGVFTPGADYLTCLRPPPPPPPPLFPLLWLLIFWSNFVLSLSQFHFRCLILPNTFSLTSQSVAMEIRLCNFADGLRGRQKIDWVGNEPSFAKRARLWLWLYCYQTWGRQWKQSPDSGCAAPRLGSGSVAWLVCASTGKGV